jgi:hypothetical protein
MRDDRCGVLLNRVTHFDLAVIAMYLMADAVAGWQKSTAVAGRTL